MICMKKKILVLGVGAQGSTVAQRLDDEPNVAEIICADYDEKAVNNLVKILKKARGVKVDATKKDEIVKIAKGVDLIVNALPLYMGKQVLDAALEVKANYQDFSSPTNIIEDAESTSDWIDGIKIMYTDYDKKFAEIGKTALTATGSAPGLICVVARRAVRELDSCDTINMLVYEGGEAKRFLPFWWSPADALADMSEVGMAFIDGKIVETEAFGLPVSRKFPEMDGKEVIMVEHHHDEPVHMGINAEKYFKGAKNIYFKYGGVGMNFARPLYRAGLLSQEDVLIDGEEVCPFDVILAHIPPAPKYREEIKEIIEEGLVADEGAFVVEAYGKKNGKDVMVDAHISAPGLLEAFERAGLTGEMYLTGQSGFAFTKMFVDDQFTQHGLFSSDMLTEEQNDYYLNLVAKFDITLDLEVKEVK